MPQTLPRLNHVHRLSLRHRILLIFVGMATGSVLALVLGLYYGYYKNANPWSLDAVIVGGVVAAFCILALTFGVWWLFDEHVAKPIERLTGELRTRAHSHVDSHLQDLEARHLGDLAAAASSLMRHLNEARNELAETVASETTRHVTEKERLIGVLGDVPVGILVCAADHRLVFYNAEAGKLLGAASGVSRYSDASAEGVAAGLAKLRGASATDPASRLARHSDASAADSGASVVDGGFMSAPATVLCLDRSVFAYLDAESIETAYATLLEQARTDANASITLTCTTCDPDHVLHSHMRVLGDGRPAQDGAKTQGDTTENDFRTADSGYILVLEPLAKREGSVHANTDSVGRRQTDARNEFSGRRVGSTSDSSTGTEAPPTGDACSSTETLPTRAVVYDFELLHRTWHADIAHTPLHALTYVVFDTETTGLLPDSGDKIVQLAAVRIVNGRRVEAERFDTLVNPARDIPAASTRIHGITDDMVATAPHIEVAARRFHDFSDGAVLVAHNAGFDMAFLRRLERRIGFRFDQPVLDTVLLSALVFGDGENHSLDALAARLAISLPEEIRHTAIGDASATAEALLKLLRALQARGLHTYGDLEEELQRHRRVLKAGGF